MFRRSDSNCSRKMCRAMFRRSDSNCSRKMCRAMFHRSDSNCSRQMCRAMFHRSDSNSTMNLCHEKSHPNNSPTTTRTMLSRNIFPLNNAFREIFSDDVSPKDIFRKMFCDALTTASRPFVPPSLSPIPSSVRASVPLSNPPRPYVHPSLSPIPLVRSCIRPSRQSPSSVYVRAFPTFDSHIAASSFNIVVPLAHERRLAGGDEWTRSGNESQPMRSCSLCAHAAYEFYTG